LAISQLIDSFNFNHEKKIHLFFLINEEKKEENHLNEKFTKWGFLAHCWIFWCY